MKRELPDAADTSYKLKRLALSGDGNFAIVARGPPADALESKPRNDVLTLFAAKDGKVLLTTDVANGVLDATGSTTQISFSPDSKRVMAAGANVAVWNVADGKKTASIKSSATAVAFSDDGKWIVAGTSSGAAYALQLDTPQATAKTFQGSGDLILAVGYDARSGHVIEGLEDGSLRIVDGGDVERWVHPAPSSNNAVNAIAFSPNLRTAVVAGDDGLTAWHLGTSSEDITLASAGPFTDASISSDGRLALVRSENRRASLAGARLFDTATGHSLTPAGFPTGRSSAAVLSRNGKTIAAVIDYELVIWSLDPAQELRRISLRMPAISDPPAIAITSDGSTVALSGRANTLLVYRAMGTSEPAKLTGHSGRITSIAFSESGHEVLTGSEDMTARAWNVDTGASIATLFGHAAPINSVALSMDGTVAITASGELTATDNSVRVWTLPSGRQLMTLDIGKNSAPLRSVAISGDGRLIAAGDNRDSSATVMIWTRADGMPLRTILTRRGIARALSFDQSGQYLLSGADSAEVWNFGWAKQGAELKKDLDTAPVGKATNLATLARWYNYAAEPDWALSLNEGAPSLTPLESARCEWIAGHLELALEKLNSVGAQEAPSYYVKLCAEAIRAERSAK
jgi:WD40 repeat protein